MARGIRQFGFVVLAITLAACLTALLLTSHNPRQSSTGWLSLSKPPSSQGDSFRWLSLSKPPGPHSQSDILRQWDQRRAAAYASGSVPRLRRLYVPWSQAGLRDVRLLRSYAARGLVVTGMQMRLLSVDVVRSDSHRLVLRVRDQLTRVIARSRVDRSVHRRLPTDHPSTHVVTLTRLPSHPWRVSSVR